MAGAPRSDWRATRRQVLLVGCRALPFYAAITAALPSPATLARPPAPRLKPQRGEAWSDGTYWEDGDGWIE